MTGRRFPPPWQVIEHAESFWVQDASGQTVGWFYFRTDPLVAKDGRRAAQGRSAADGGELRTAAGVAWQN
jgi:hypothetical protein